jgi:outer membrane lipoprotein-sorting protein
MRTTVRWSALLVVAALGTGTAEAQAQTQAKAQAQAKVQAQAPTQTPTAEDVIEKHLAAMGGRAALAKLETRIATGSIVVSTQGMDLAGSVEIYAKAPNKARSYIRLDLSQAGGTEMVIDQRCDGKTAFVSDSLRGDRDITGSQLQNMLNGSFPTPLLKYKDAGTKVEFVGKDKVGMRDAVVLLYTPKAGSSSRQYFDAETYLLLRTVMKAGSPESGGEIEQTSDLSDYRESGGVKIPFTVQIISPAQTVTIRLDKIEHNKPIDESMFAKPVAK